MASYFISAFFKVRGSFSTVKNPVRTSSKLLHAAHSLSSRDSKSNFRKTVNRHDGPSKEHRGVEARSSALLHFHPSSVFSAGTAKKRAEIQRRREGVEEEHTERGAAKTEGRLQPPDRPLTPAEWKLLRESHRNLKVFDIAMMNVLLASKSELRVAKSLLTFVATETGTLSYNLLLRYLALCVCHGHDHEVPDVYEIMRSSFSCLETGAASLFIRSFSRTGNWSRALSLLQEIFKPSARNYGDVIAALMRHGQLTAAWTLYQELMDNGQTPFQETWSSLFQPVVKDTEGQTTSLHQQQQRLLGILHYMRNNQIYPQERLAHSIKAWFESLPGQKWTGRWTSVHPRYVLCPCCGSDLESIQLTVEEYQQLKDRVMTDVIQGPDIFTKTTPRELGYFKEFVKQRAPFDVVVDGLNVASSNVGKCKQSTTVRKDKVAWDPQDMKLIRQRAHCFYTDNISEDDPYLLYAALHSGAQCVFVSKDLMRDHKASLQDQTTRRVFFKWQRGHQLVLDGYVVEGRTVRYDTVVQTSGDSWHIPYDDQDDQDRTTYEVPQKWLCLTQQ
uniref:Mitochondrial ribonuclease P catalytic subunit n=1 Tax=Cynoglossus semilaevis TaxID=244447 RepID=A0A3P8UCC5_CYNSE